MGLKSEGRVDLKEFSVPGQATDIKVGDIIDIFVERFEDRDGIVRLRDLRRQRQRQAIGEHAGGGAHDETLAMLVP